MMSKMAAAVAEENFENFMKILKENVVNIREMCNKYKQNASGIEEFVARSLEKLKRLDDLLHADACCSEAAEVEQDGEKKEHEGSETQDTEEQSDGKTDDKSDEEGKATLAPESETQEGNLEKSENCVEGDKNESTKTVLPKDESVESILQLYAQVLLDVTFCEENILVDGIFPEKNAKSRVHKLLGMLRQPEVICQHCFPEKTPKELLGEEVLECLLWRRGALLYMYCHTIQEESSRLDRERSHFIENCKQGALFLKQMLTVRTPITDVRVQVAKSEDVLALLKKGLFSDTHVLSLIYTGELCYWYIKHYTEAVEDPDFDSRQLGSGVLHLFLEMVRGPLKDHGWSSQRATQLLEFIEAES